MECSLTGRNCAERYTMKKWRGGEINSKLVVCNREGFTHKAPNKDQSDELVGENSQRRFRVTRVGCKARIRLYMKNGVLLIDRFHEGHNYELISLKDREFQKLSRNITDYHKMIIVSNSRVNGFANIGASFNDFKNFHRDVKCFLHKRDGQLFVDHFKEMTETRIGFYFDYDINDDGSLHKVLWADNTARENYKIFGDAVSFDPTYSTNKYSMVFTPFTGVDHHKRLVMFCGALIGREDYESFNWVFSQSDYSDFMRKLNDIIWDEELEAVEFDAIWEKIIEEHALGDNDWFADTYAIRGQWVMAHCRDLKMTSVMRMTQRSESENSFFKREEAIYSIDTRRTGGFTERDELEVTTVNDSSRGKNFEVAYSPALTDDPGTRKVSCSCTMFERTGVLCHHIIWIFSANGMKTIPDDYVVNRWTKEYLRLMMFNCNGEGTYNMEIIDGKQIVISIMWSEVHQTVRLLWGKGVTDVESFSAIIRGFKDTLSPLGEVLNKNQQMEKILHCTASEVVTIFPPKNSKNKGSGKRMLSTTTKALTLARKPKRKFKNFKRMTNHDKRNCPNRFLAHTPLCEGSSEQEEDEGEEEEELASEEE
ncbi:protein FAR1-RELATED SEQUENCE 5-like [Silene latifolia]|uniref:protein FAR1-RELATED SEQUENCE 5-like n=1 Tax=Silene latifolia TaxID=37657 RepID=UPI003D7839FE